MFLRTLVRATALLAGSVALMLPSTAGAQGVSFGCQKVISDSLDGAYGIHVADLDGDGDPDVLAAAEAGDQVVWYENTGRRGFSTARIITTLTARGSGLECLEKASDHVEQMMLLLGHEPEHHKTSALRRRVRANVREVDVEGQEHSAFRPADRSKLFIRCPTKRLITNRHGVMTGLSEGLRGRRRDVLVELELHAVLHAGIATTRSRARSAA